MRGEVGGVGEGAQSHDVLHFHFHNDEVMRKKRSVDTPPSSKPSEKQMNKENKTA